MSEMSYLGLLVNAGRRGSESLWMGSTDYLAAPRNLPDPEECTVELVRKYIERYGPVTREDIAYWSFLRKDQVDAALEGLKADLKKEKVDSSAEYFSLAPEPRARIPGSEQPRGCVPRQDNRDSRSVLQP